MIDDTRSEIERLRSDLDGLDGAVDPFEGWTGAVEPTEILGGGGGLDLTRFAIGYKIKPDGSTWNKVRIFAGYVDGVAVAQTDLTLTATSVVYLKLVYPNSGSPTATIAAAESLPANTATDKYFRLYQFVYDETAETLTLGTVYRTLNIDGALRIPQGSQAEDVADKVQSLIWDQASGAWVVSETEILAGTEDKQVQRWDATAEDWTDLAVFPDGTEESPHMIWDSATGKWGVGKIEIEGVPDGSAGAPHLIWNSATSAWSAGKIKEIPNGSSINDIIRWNGSGWSPVSATSLTVVTGIRYDATSRQFQIKTQEIEVLSKKPESGWTLMSGGQAGGCP